MELKVQKIGDDFGVVIPQDVVDRLNLVEGDRLFLAEAPDGGYRITPFDSEVDTQVQLARGIVSRYANALKELAQ